jgi:DnaJ-class molecular chaperone
MSLWSRLFGKKQPSEHKLSEYDQAVMRCKSEGKCQYCLGLGRIAVSNPYGDSGSCSETCEHCNGSGVESSE